MNKKTLFVIILLVTIALIGCSREPPIIIRNETKSVEMKLWFVPNINPALDMSLLYPRPGIHDFDVNKTITLRANDSNKYKFYKWEIKKGSTEAIEVFENEHEIFIDERYVVNAFFGCTNDDSCNRRFVCEEKLCVPIEEIIPPPFKITVSELNINEKDPLVGTNVKIGLEDKGYIDIKDIVFFEETNATNIKDEVILVLFDGKAFIIVSEELEEEYKEFIGVIRELLIQEMHSRNIKKVFAEEITNHDLLYLVI